MTFESDNHKVNDNNVKDSLECYYDDLTATTSKLCTLFGAHLCSNTPLSNFGNLRFRIFVAYCSAAHKLINSFVNLRLQPLDIQDC